MRDGREKTAAAGVRRRPRSKRNHTHLLFFSSLSPPSFPMSSTDAPPSVGLPLDAAAGARALAFIAGVGIAAELLLAVWAFGGAGFKSVRVRDVMENE